MAVNKPAEFTVDAKHAGKAPLRVQVQVGCLLMLGIGLIGFKDWVLSNRMLAFVRLTGQ